MSHKGKYIPEVFNFLFFFDLSRIFQRIRAYFEHLYLKMTSINEKYG